MANLWGVKLSRAIRERAYTSGALARKATEVEALQLALDVAKGELKMIEECLSDLDQRIADLSAIDASEIRPMNRFPKSGLFEFGELSDAIVRVLKESPEPLPTPVIVTLVAKSLDLPTDRGPALCLAPQSPLWKGRTP